MQDDDPSLLSADLENARFTALVALPAQARLAEMRLVEEIKNLFPRRTASIGVVRSDGIDQPSLVFPWGDMLVAIVALPFSIPAETVRAALGNELIWNGAADAFSRSKAHLLVSVMGLGKDFEISRLKAFRLTVTVAALCGLGNALGVFWTASESVIEPGRFVRVAREANETTPPADLWISPRFFPGFVSADHLVCRTSGLIPFAGRELECGPVSLNPGDLAGLVLGIARYIVHSGAKFEDGASISDGGNPIGTIRYEVSRFDGVDTQVLKLQLAERG
jgi:hypothetical protein